MARRSGLGRGLSALIPTETAGESSSTRLLEVPVNSIEPNPRQPRRAFDEEALATLTASVEQLGVLQPLLLRPVGGDRQGPTMPSESGSEPERPSERAAAGPQYELIAGERRWRAAKRAGLAVVPALVKDVSDLESMEQAVVENLHRQDLNALEEAAAYQQLLDDFHLTHEQLASRVGKSRAAVTNTIRLLQLPSAIQRYVRHGELGGSHARALLGTPDRGFQEALARRTVADGLSVRAVEEAVRARSRTGAPSPTSQAPRRLRAPGLLELEELLSAHLATRVKVEMGKSKGRVVIEFATLEDLERIYRAMTGTV